MKTLSTVSILAAAFVFAGAANAGKPVKDIDGNLLEYLGNGFPSGQHFNLNLNAKRNDFECPAPSGVIDEGEPDAFEAVKFCLNGVVAYPADDPNAGLNGQSCTQTFGKVIFIPREEDGPDADTDTDDITIEIQSGRGGSKGKKGSTSATDTLEVTDWCTESFPDFGGSHPGDGAVLRLPTDADSDGDGQPEGYAVFARVLGKPLVRVENPALFADDCQNGFSVTLDGACNDGNYNCSNKEDDAEACINLPEGTNSFDFVSRQITLVEDEFGNNLFLLGLLSDDTVFDRVGLPLTREDTQKKGKAAQKATDLSALFQFDGELCFINQADIDLFCTDADPACEERANEAGAWQVCCAGADLDEGTGELTFCDTCPPEADGYALCQDSVVTEFGNICPGGPFAFEAEDTTAVCPGDGCNPANDGDGICDTGNPVEDPTAEVCDGTNEGTCDPANDGDGICEANVIEDNAADGGNDDFVCDSGESCILADELCSTDDETCLTVGEVEDPAAFCDGTNEDTCNPANDGDGICEDLETCETADAALCETVPLCKDFSGDNAAFIFHLSEFVNVVFGIDNEHSFHVNIRFYPLPLQDNPNQDDPAP